MLMLARVGHGVAAMTMAEQKPRADEVLVRIDSQRGAAIVPLFASRCRSPTNFAIPAIAHAENTRDDAR